MYRKINGVRVKLSMEDYLKLQRAEERASVMQQIIRDAEETTRIVRRRDEARSLVRAPPEKYIVCIWNPENPEKSIPCQVAGPYTIRNFAVAYARKMNSRPERRPNQYLAVDSRGIQVL